jgi:cytochrome c oxidase cbb3-type subunit III
VPGLFEKHSQWSWVKPNRPSRQKDDGVPGLPRKLPFEQGQAEQSLPAERTYPRNEPIMANDQLLEHEYDGIQEYDNPCPGWWHAIFWMTVLFSVIYFLFYHVGDKGSTLAQAWNAAKAEDMKQRFSGIGELKNDVPTLLKYKDDPEWMIYANSVFLTNCQSCHGPDGSGVVGPNLTDNYYRDVKKIWDIADVIANGRAGGNMPAWKTRLEPNEIVLMAAYVAGLRDKNRTGKAIEPEKDKLIVGDWTKPDEESPAGMTSPRSSGVGRGMPRGKGNKR